MMNKPSVIVSNLYFLNNYGKSVQFYVNFLSHFGFKGRKFSWIGSVKILICNIFENYFRTIPWKGQAWSRFCKMISSLKATCHPGSPLPVWLWHPGSIPNSNKSSVDHCKKSTKKLLLQVESETLGRIRWSPKRNHEPIFFPGFLRASWRLPNLHTVFP